MSRRDLPDRTEGRAGVVTFGLSVFVPARNESGNLEGAIQDIIEAAESRFIDYEILLVDDGSTDGTSALADRLERANPRIRAIHHPQPRGIAFGYQAALALATKGYFAFIPGDREINVASIRAIFGAVGTADLVVPYHANREARAWYRRVMTWVTTSLINALFWRRLRYYQGPTVYPTALARQLPARTGGFFFLAEKLLYALDHGCTYVEVGLLHQERVFGRSKAVTVANILVALQTIFETWWTLRVRNAQPALGVAEPVDSDAASDGPAFEERAKS